MPRPTSKTSKAKAKTAGGHNTSKSTKTTTSRGDQRQAKKIAELKKQHLASKQLALKNEQKALKELRAERPKFPGNSANESAWETYSEKLAAFDEAVATKEHRIDRLHQDINDIHTGTYDPNKGTFKRPEIKENKEKKDFIDIDLPNGNTVTMPKSTVKNLTPKDWQKMFRTTTGTGVIATALFTIAAANTYGDIKQSSIMADVLKQYIDLLADEEIIN